MSSKKFKKRRTPTETKKNVSTRPKLTVWMVRIVVILLCVAVAITLIPSVFF